MKFQVAALIQAAHDTMDADAATYLQKVADWDAEQVEKSTQWLNDYGHLWLDAMTAARRKIRSGRPITREDLPREQHGSTAFFGINNYGKPGQYRPDPDLVALLRILSTVADETVTSSGLRELGITAATLRRCVQHLGRHAVTN